MSDTPQLDELAEVFADAARWKYVAKHFIGVGDPYPDGTANFRVGGRYVARARTLEDAVDKMIEIERHNLGGR